METGIHLYLFTALLTSTTEIKHNLLPATVTHEAFGPMDARSLLANSYRVGWQRGAGMWAIFKFPR